jgi:hypothetical protein
MVVCFRRSLSQELDCCAVLVESCDTLEQVTLNSAALAKTWQRPTCIHPAGEMLGGASSVIGIQLAQQRRLDWMWLIEPMGHIVPSV